MDLMDQKIKHEELWGAEPNATEDELSDIIGSLSRLFSSTYYVNLEQDTYRAVIQLRRVGDVLGNEVNYTSAIRIYAQYFVHPEDQAEYLQAMDVENLRRELRWWQPCVAVEFRKLPDDAGSDNCGWVRATAVLAQNDADDMPKTVVYAAQDISGSRHER